MELYARVRRAVIVDKMSEREAARQFGLARETVRKMLRYSVPPGYRRQQPVRRPKLGAWVGTIDQILEARQGGGQEAAPHGQADLRAAARRAQLHGRLHDREGLRAAQEAESARDVRAAGASAGRRAGRLRRSDGGDRRGGAQGALPGGGPAAVRRLLRDGLSGRDDGSVPGRSQPRLRVLRRSAAHDPLRQHQDRRWRGSWAMGRG